MSPPFPNSKANQRLAPSRTRTTKMQKLTERVEGQELMIQGLRGHLSALDHALRLLIAGCPDIDIIQSAWLEISNDLRMSAENSATPEAVFYNHALLQCAGRIANQLNVAMEFRTEEFEANNSVLWTSRSAANSWLD